jgi:ABC-type phosphate transport system substrate-binding protein
MVSPGAASAGELGAQCSGVEITGQGAAVEKVAQTAWTGAFNTSSAKFACSGKQGDKKTPKVNYKSTSSGAGLRSWGAEYKSVSEISFGPGNAFVATAEAPNSAQEADIIGEESSKTSGTLETLPVAQFALTVYVNLGPECDASSTESGVEGRLAISDATLQKIYSGEYTKWSQVAGAADQGDTITGPGCQENITAVVRGEKAGTTNVLKKYLYLINKEALSTSSGSLTWQTLSEGKDNVIWPTALNALPTKVEGDAAEAELVAKTPGSIGYSNLAELRETKLFSGAGNGAKTPKFWVEIENGSKGTGSKLKVTYQDPSHNGDSETADGANCAKTAYTNGKHSFPPPSVTELWNEVTTSVPTAPEPLTEKTYSLCNFTYMLAFTEYHLVPETTLPEATAVNNYLRFISEKTGGQSLLAPNDYYALPKGEVLTDLEDGAKAVEF